MSLLGILLGLIDIAIVVAIFMLIGAIIMWVIGALSWPPPTTTVQKGYIAVVALIALVMIIKLLAGVPGIHIITTG